jgi:hypothetical protein
MNGPNYRIVPIPASPIDTACVAVCEHGDDGKPVLRYLYPDGHWRRERCYLGSTERIEQLLKTAHEPSFTMTGVERMEREATFRGDDHHRLMLLATC